MGSLSLRRVRVGVSNSLKFLISKEKESILSFSRVMSSAALLRSMKNQAPDEFQKRRQNLLRAHFLKRNKERKSTKEGSFDLNLFSCILRNDIFTLLNKREVPGYQKESSISPRSGNCVKSSFVRGEVALKRKLERP